MRRYAMLSVLAGAAALTLFGASADAGGKKAARSVVETQEGRDVRTSRAYRRAPQVRGFVQRRGGYSYAASDSINTYGDTQSRYSNYSLFRNGQFGRQSSSGPFDSDFFFDSGVSPRGGNAPFQF